MGIIQDSRLKFSRTDHQMAGPHGLFLDKVYCLSCGRAAGLSFPDTTLIMYVCTRCAETYGGLPLPEIPDSELHRFMVGKHGTGDKWLD